MILNEGQYYLYRHVRLDTNEVFYIGIGTKLKSQYFRTIYKRAFCIHRENFIWKSITLKTDYEVEILLESDCYKFIKEKEIEFIKLYGRKNLKEGTLSNMTNGGEGVKGRVPSKEWRENHSKMMTGRKGNVGRTGKSHTESTKSKISESNKNKVLSQETKDKISKFRKDNNIAKGENNPMFGKNYGSAPKSVKIINIITLEIYDSIKRASEQENINKSTLSGYLNNRIPNKTNLRYLKDFEHLLL